MQHIPAILTSVVIGIVVVVVTVGAIAEVKKKGKGPRLPDLDSNDDHLFI
ncbi:hypothetical protein ACFQ21_00255 [Ohtaekwangia kribbensis]|uniref:Uncharacterized protein n=1 Tax=Ohtaekwangia kribbensis TaxID=688913 RepID=A0ABW3JVA4_9BACT